MRLDVDLAKMGYYLNSPARYVGHCVERVLRPFHIDGKSVVGQHGFEKTLTLEVLVRIQAVVSAILLAPVALFVLPFSTIALSLSSAVRPNDCRNKRLQFKEGAVTSTDDKKLSVLFWNVCLQGGPFAALTGNVTSLHERFDDTHADRVAALADFIDKEAPDVVCLSEDHDLGAMEKLRKLLAGKGYNFSLSDVVGHGICVNSGMFVASKKKISNYHFIPFPLKDRTGVHLGAELGCVVFDVLDNQNQKIVKIATSHLNFGQKALDVRKLQLEAVFKDIGQEEALFGGDFNWEYLQGKNWEQLTATATPSTVQSLLPTDVSTTRFTFEEGGSVRGKKKREVIDAVLLVNRHNADNWSARVIEPELNGAYVSDHYAVLATLKNKQKARLAIAVTEDGSEHEIAVPKR